MSSVAEKVRGLDDFMRHYLIAALWSSNEMDEDGNCGEPLDAEYDLDDLSEVTLAAAIKDCANFQEAHDAWLSQAGDDEQNGHDFWLTRNRHGAGFWDRGYGPVGAYLTDAAHTYGNVDLFVGDDGQIHGV